MILFKKSKKGLANILSHLSTRKSTENKHRNWDTHNLQTSVQYFQRTIYHNHMLYQKILKSQKCISKSVPFFIVLMPRFLYVTGCVACWCICLDVPITRCMRRVSTSYIPVMHYQGGWRGVWVINLISQVYQTNGSIYIFHTHLGSTLEALMKYKLTSTHHYTLKQKGDQEKATQTVVLSSI